MGNEQSKYHHADNYIMDHIKHTYCTNTKCRTSPCAQYDTTLDPPGYICDDCFRLYREQHEKMACEAKISRERKERDLREYYAQNVDLGEGRGWMGMVRKGGEGKVMWDGDKELREWKREERMKAKAVERKRVGGKEDGDGSVEGEGKWKGKDFVDLKERFQGMFLPFYVGMEDDEWQVVEGGDMAANGWHDL